jgi:hypothetical protein
MKTSANYRTATPAPGAWLPAQATLPRAIDLSHWLSRAARGHTWNGHGATARRRPH